MVTGGCKRGSENNTLLLVLINVNENITLISHKLTFPLHQNNKTAVKKVRQ